MVGNVATKAICRPHSSLIRVGRKKAKAATFGCSLCYGDTRDYNTDEPFASVTRKQVGEYLKEVGALMGRPGCLCDLIYVIADYRPYGGAKKTAS